MKPWRKAQRVSSEAAPSPKWLWPVGDLAKEDMLRRVSPKKH
jgi:hypothetical protein